MWLNGVSSAFSLLTMMLSNFFGTPKNATDISDDGMFEVDEFSTTESSLMERPLVGRSVVLQVVTSISILSCTFVGTLGNTLVILAIVRDPALQVKNQLANLTILNLAVTDLMTSLLVAAPAAVNVIYGEWDTPFPYWFCKFGTMMNIGTIGTTYNILAVVSIERFIAVRWPLHHPQIVTKDRLNYALGYCWTMGMGIGFKMGILEKDWAYYDYWAGICDAKYDGADLPSSEQKRIMNHTYFASFFEFLINTIVIVYTNFMIIHLSKDKGRAGTKEAAAEASVNKKILKAMMLVIFFFIFLNAPAAMVRLFKVTAPHVHFPAAVTSFFQVSLFLASVVNPFIYGLFRKDFQQAFKKLKKDFVKYIKREA